MEIETRAKLLTAESKPYNVDGNVGTSYKIRLNIDGEIYVCRSTEAQVLQMKEHEKAEGVAVLKVNSRKENLSLELYSFVAE